MSEISSSVSTNGSIVSSRGSCGRSSSCIVQEEVGNDTVPVFSIESSSGSSVISTREVVVLVSDTLDTSLANIKPGKSVVDIKLINIHSVIKIRRFLCIKKDNGLHI